MASSRGFLEYILNQLSPLPYISHRSMMGEFVLYDRGRIFGGIYDDRLLVKDVPAARKLAPEAPEVLPYAGAKRMLLVENVDDREFLRELVLAMHSELPEPKKRRKK